MSPIQDLGGGILLTAVEMDCYRLLQRQWYRQLLRNALGIIPLFKSAARTRLHARMPFKSMLLVVLLLALMPLLLAWQLGSWLMRLLVLPLQLIIAQLPPQGLTAPGEKTLTGMHNAFMRFYELDNDNYAHCIDLWIERLYGTQALEKYSLERALSRERRRLGLAGNLWGPSDQDHMRSFLNQAREHYSQLLGHYLANPTQTTSRKDSSVDRV